MSYSKIKKIIKYLKVLIFPSAHQKMVKKWVSDKGDESMRLNYDLNADSVVLDLGGYKGQWASDIYSMYLCDIHIFEPVKIFFTGIKNRFKYNDNIYVYEYGLGAENERLKLGVDEDASGICADSKNHVNIAIKNFDRWLKDKEIKHIDLVKINIEGGEYDLIDHMISSGCIINISNLQVQFHDFFPDAEKRMNDIHALLSKTHVLTYSYPFVWENWRLIEG